MEPIKVYIKFWPALLLVVICLLLMVTAVIIKDEVFLLSLSLPCLVLVYWGCLILFSKQWLAGIVTALAVSALAALFFVNHRLPLILLLWLPCLGVLFSIVSKLGALLVVSEQGLKYGGLYTEWGNVRRIIFNRYKSGNELEVVLENEQVFLDQYKGLKQKMILSNMDDYGDLVLLSRIGLKELKINEEELIEGIEKAWGGTVERPS